MADDSILDSVKKLIGITAEDTTFDTDIVFHINSIFMVLNQLGIGPNEGYSIEDNEPKWSDYLAEPTRFNAVKSYMVLRVKSLFDPSSTSFTQESFNREVKEMEWRLVVQNESFPVPPTP